MTGALRTAGARIGQVATWSADIILERRVSLAIIALTPLLFVLFLALAPPVNPTFDDAKYVGVGRNYLSGNGPVTVFGVVFLKHSPLWPMIIVIPERVLGIHAITVGHLINAVSAVATILFIAAFGWRVRPLIGAISAVLFASLPYVFDVARTAGIDLPSIALTLGYILLGFRVVRTDSLRLAFVLGLIAAVAFDIKETIIPFAPVPFLIGIMWGVRWTTLFRTSAVALGVAALGTSWWFALYASYEHAVYRADFPEWTFIPITIAIVIFVVLGLAARPLAERLRARGLEQAAWRRVPDRIKPHSRAILGWGATAGFFVLMIVFFSRTPKLLGASLFNLDQLKFFVVHSIGSVRLAFAYGLGALLLVLELVRRPGRVAQASVDVLIATISGIPLVLLVAGVGETARHYIAELGLLIVVGTIGWYHGLQRARERDLLTIVVGVALAALALAVVGVSTLTRIGPRTVIFGSVGLVVAVIVGAWVVRWLVRHERLGLAGVALATAVFLAGSSAVGVRAVRLPGQVDANETKATADIVAWVEANVPPGQTFALGPYLSMETSIDLPAGVRVIQVRHYLAIADPASPLGLRSAAGPVSDPIAVDVAPGKANQFNIYSAAQVRDAMISHRVEYYIYPVTRARSSKSILGSLTAANGFEEILTRSYAGRNDTIDVHYYRVHLDQLKLGPGIFISGDALSRLVDRLERAPAQDAVAAGTLADRIVAPADGSEQASIESLRALAGR
jgi:4-amino-4-deoxy-L-arabinose transferase-like glycosyltransferase